MDENKTRITVCRRCGRRLKTDEAQSIGFGPVCLEKMRRDEKPKPLFGGKDAKSISRIQKPEQTV